MFSSQQTFFSETASIKIDDIMIFGDVMKTKKARSAIPSNLAVVARRDLRSEAQS